MIFRVFKIYRGIQEGTKDPSGFARDEALGVLRGIIIPFTIVGILFLVGIFLLGFTEFWFGPSGFFKVVFFVFLPVFLLWFLLSQIILSLAKRITHKAKKIVDQEFFTSKETIDITPR